MKDFFSDFYNFVVDFFLWILDQIVNLGFLLLEAIPSPDFFQDLEGYANAIDPDVLYWVAPLNIPAGLGIIMTAYTIRFVLKRIPFVGG